MEYFLLLFGFVLLVKGADVFVTGASSIAKKFNIPDLIIGLTIVAFGTSAPEVAVSTVASLNGQNSMAISNIIGSNIFNLLLVLGICAIIVPINVTDKDIIKRDFPFNIIASVVLVIMLADSFIGNGDINVLSRADGIILLIAFSIFMYTVIKSALGSMKSAENVSSDSQEEIKEVSFITSLVMIVLGLGAVVLGGDVVVDSASTIATSFGISETVIGLTIVAMGTSLPELVTSVIACKKGSSDMALGNVIGSNLFNILFTLGICSTISPITVEILSIYDAIILLGFTITAFICAKTGYKITRPQGFMLVALFVCYNVYIFIR